MQLPSFLRLVCRCLLELVEVSRWLSRHFFHSHLWREHGRCAVELIKRSMSEEKSIEVSRKGCNLGWRARGSLDPIEYHSQRAASSASRRERGQWMMVRNLAPTRELSREALVVAAWRDHRSSFLSLVFVVSRFLCLVLLSAAARILTARHQQRQVDSFHYPDSSINSACVCLWGRFFHLVLLSFSLAAWEYVCLSVGERV